MNRIIAVVFVGVFLFVGIGHAVPITLYDGSGTPNAQGWTQTTAGTVSGGNTVVTNVNTTTFETTAKAINYYTYDTGMSDFIVSMRVRVEDSHYNPKGFGLGLSVFGHPSYVPTDDYINGLTIGETEILWADNVGGSYSIDTSSFHEYAMRYSNGNLDVFVDQSYDSIISGTASSVLSRPNVTPANSSFYAGLIGFGDGSNDPASPPYNSSRYELDYVKFESLDQSAVPEPTTMLLLGTGLIGLAGTRRKLKKK